MPEPGVPGDAAPGASCASRSSPACRREVQDALVTILSEKVLPVPELDTEVQAVAGLQPHRHRQRPRPRRQRAVERPAAAVQHRRAAAAGRPPRRRWPSSPAASASSARRSPCRRSRRPPTRSAASSRSSASCATASPSDGRTSLKVPSGTLSTAEAISVVTNGLALAAHFGDGTLVAGRRRRRHRRRRRERPGATTTSRGASTSRGWCATAPAGATSTTPAATSADPAGTTPGLHLLGIRHHGPGSARSVVRALDELRPGDRARRAAGRLPASLLTGSATRACVPPVALLGYVVDRAATRPRSAPFAEFSPEWQAVRWAWPTTRPVRGDRPAAGRRRWRRPTSDDDRRGARAAGRPARRAGRGGRRARRRAVVGGRHRAPRRRRAGVRRRRRGDGRGARRHDARPATTPGARRTCAGPSAPRSPTPVRPRRRGVRGLARAGARSDRGRRRRPTPRTAAAACPKVEGRRQLGAVDAPPAGARPPATAPACAARAGTPRVPPPRPRRASPASSSRPPALLRGRGLAASPDHLIAAARARRRAGRAARPAAGRAGRGARRRRAPCSAGTSALPLVIDELIVGDAIGAVPAEAPQVPLARDLAAPAAARSAQARRRRPTVELDLRTPNGLRRSHLLHRLDALGVAWGTLEEGRGTQRDVPRDVAADVGARADRSASSSCAGHGTTRRGGGDAPAGRAGRRRRRARRRGVGCVDLALLADLPDAVVGAARSLGALAAAATPTSPS